MFKLTRPEVDSILMSQNVTSSWGGSSKDAGKRITTITKIEEKELYKSLIDEILNNDELNI